MGAAANRQRDIRIEPHPSEWSDNSHGFDIRCFGSTPESHSRHRDENIDVDRSWTCEGGSMANSSQGATPNSKSMTRSSASPCTVPEHMPAHSLQVCDALEDHSAEAHGAVHWLEALA